MNVFRFLWCFFVFNLSLWFINGFLGPGQLQNTLFHITPLLLRNLPEKKHLDDFT